MSKFFAALQTTEAVEEEPIQETPVEADVEEEDTKTGKGKKKNKNKKKEPEANVKPATAEKVEANKTEAEVESKVQTGNEKPKGEEIDEKKDEEGEEGDDDVPDAKDGKKKAKAKKKEKPKVVSGLAEKIKAEKAERERIRLLEEEMKRQEEEEERRRLEEEERLKKEAEEAERQKHLIKQAKIESGEWISSKDRKREQKRLLALERVTMLNEGKSGLTAATSRPGKRETIAEEAEETEKGAEQKEQQAVEETKEKGPEAAKRKQSTKEDSVKNSRKNSKASRKVSAVLKGENDGTGQDGLLGDNWESDLIIEEEEGEQKNDKGKKNDKSKTDKKEKTTRKEKNEQKIIEEAKLHAQQEPQADESAPRYADPRDVFNIDSPYRCPIICILGHVDTGKTKLLDKIRRTNVQSGEAGGITQQIGASFLPQYKLKEEIAKLNTCYKDINVEIPGLLIIDTPGHESFSNLRKRGESLCDFAILVVDCKHSLENQTIESLNMLREKNTPFIVAFNKIDVLKDWKPQIDGSSLKSLREQSSYTQELYRQFFNVSQNDFAQHGILIQNYWENPDIENNQSIIPTSAHTGEGLPDLLGYITEYCQTSLKDKITRKEEFNCSIMEVKKIDGLGTTIDAILVDGNLKEGDKIVLSGFEGPIKTTVRSILTPQPMKELRVKAE
jgi:translation initiation factor 5B